MWLALDDTDGPQGSCTTHALLGVVASGQCGDLIGLPRLVRLNPNVPWKTRGNGALVARFGIGRGEGFRVGTWCGEPIMAYPETAGDVRATARAVLELLDDTGLREADSATGVILSPTPLPEAGYWSAVHGVLELDQVITDLRERGLDHAWSGDGRGLIGAWAALGWPGMASAYEGIVYRDQAARDRDRTAGPEQVDELVGSMPDQTYNIAADGTRHCVPHTRCPIELGIRSRSEAGWGLVMERAQAYGFPGALLFATNHASGDHFQDPDGPLAPLHSYRLAVTCLEPGVWGGGGHLRMRTEADGRTLDLVAFEPTKGLRHGLAAIWAGERFHVWGAYTDRGTLTVEGFQRHGMENPRFAPYGARRHLTPFDPK